MIDQPNPQVDWRHRAKGYYESAQTSIGKTYGAYQKRYPKTDSYLNKPKNIVQVLTLVFVGVYTVVSCQQSDIQRTTLEVVSDQEHRQLRAYVGPVFATFGLFNAKNDSDVLSPYPNAIEYKLKNYGLTPTQRVSSCAAGMILRDKEVFDSVIESKFQACDRSIALETILPTVQPNEERLSIAHVEQPQFIEQAMADHRAFFLAYVTYRDVFGAAHHTYICRTFTKFSKGVAAFENCKIRKIRQDD